MSGIDEGKVKELVERLRESGSTLSLMESCTGGELASAITNVAGSGEVFEFGAVTYSNKYKVYFGKEAMQKTINEHSVYSMETAKQMAKTIIDTTGSTYGVGITGELGNVDQNEVDVAIYDYKTDHYDTFHLQLEGAERRQNKHIIINKTVEMLTGYISR